MLGLDRFSKKEKKNCYLVGKVAWTLIPVLSCNWSSNKPNLRLSNHCPLTGPTSIQVVVAVKERPACNVVQMLSG